MELTQRDVVGCLLTCGNRGCADITNWARWNYASEVLLTCDVTSSSHRCGAVCSAAKPFLHMHVSALSTI